MEDDVLTHDYQECFIIVMHLYCEILIYCLMLDLHKCYWNLSLLLNFYRSYNMGTMIARFGLYQGYVNYYFSSFLITCFEIFLVLC
jgi:hypothetical protein